MSDAELCPGSAALGGLNAALGDDCLYSSKSLLAGIEEVRLCPEQ